MMKQTLLHFTSLLVALLTLGARIAARPKDRQRDPRHHYRSHWGTGSCRTGLINGADGAIKSVTAGRDGAFLIGPIRPGKYTLVITAEVFAPTTTVENVQLAPGKSLEEKITLKLPIEEQQVQVKEETEGLSTSADETRTRSSSRARTLTRAAY